MRVELAPDAARLLNQIMALGRYTSESDAILTALGALTRELKALDDVDWEYVNRQLAESPAEGTSDRGIPAERVIERARELIRAKTAVPGSKH